MKPFLLVLTAVLISSLRVAAGVVHYVDLNSANPIAPYTNWATAAAIIQDAIDVAQASDTVLVTNGVYAAGGRSTIALGGATNRVLLTNAITLLSVNGPGVTVIKAGTIVRCAYITSNSVVSGFTLTNGWSGGVICESGAVVTNCIIVGNAGGPQGGGVYLGTLYHCLIASNTSYGAGAGAYRSTLYYCVLSNNIAAAQGGGAYQCTLYNCVLQNNRAYIGGGAAFSSLYQCTVAANFATNSGGGTYQGKAFSSIICSNSAATHADYDSTILNNYCWFESDPRFVDLAAGDLRLQSDSPCINSGLNANAPGDADLDGNPRIVGNTIDIGAYEYQTPLSLLSYGWLQYYGLPTDGSADFIDTDLDGLNNWQEWRANTVPTNALSLLKMLSPFKNTGPGWRLRWQSTNGTSYILQCSTNLGASPPFYTINSNVPAIIFSPTYYTDTNATGPGPYFYRVGVQ